VPTAGSVWAATKRILPAPVKGRLKELARAARLRRVVRQFRRREVGAPVDRRLVARLRSAWGNDAFTAPLEFLEVVADRAMNTGGPILECGTGCSTLLLGLVASERGAEVWSLEHDARWRQFTARILEDLGVNGIRILHAPLRSHGEFDWYGPPADLTLPDRFTVVVCDGPPSTSTRGGRYGLLPVLGDRLGPGTEILMDDARRPEEAAVITRWAAERALRAHVDDQAGRGIAHLVLR
jgi:hypothetical protein